MESQVVADENGECLRDFCVSKAEYAWIATFMAIGSLAFGFIAGLLVSIIGRKTTLLAFFVPLIGGWLFLTFATAGWMLYVGRLLVGITAGGSGVIVPIYIGEIAQTSIRGKLLSYFQLDLTIGNLFTYVLGYFFAMFAQSAISTAVVVVFALAAFFIPESPRYFVSLSLF